MKTPSHIVVDARIRRYSTGRYVDRLIEHLQQIDEINRYTILLEPGDDWQPSAKNFSGMTCSYPRFSFNPLSLLTFGLFIKRLKPDLVHFSMTPLEPVWYFGKRITTTHDLTMLRFTRAGKLPGWLHAVRMLGYRFLFWHSLRAADHVITISKFVAGDIAQHYPFTKNKTTVTYEASEPELAGKAQPVKAVQKPFIMHLGIPFAHKNIERLIQAFGPLKQKYPGLQLVLAGKKEQYFEELERSVQDNPLKDSIIFTGFVSDAELKWLLQNAEAYVLPALSEGFGLPGLEAMTHGCPLVSSNATCSPEVYGDAAHYFDPLDVPDMVQKIDEVLSNPALRKKLIERGYARLKKYSWPRMAKQTLEVYQEVLES